MKTGLESIVESLELKMHEGTIIKGTRIEKVAKQGDGYAITLSNGKEIEADAVVVAAHIKYCHLCLPSTSNFVSSATFHPSVANVAMAFPKSAIQRDIDGTGFVVSRNSDYTLQHVRGRIKVATYNARRKNASSMLRWTTW